MSTQKRVGLSVLATLAAQAVIMGVYARTAVVSSRWPFFFMLEATSLFLIVPWWLLFVWLVVRTTRFTG